MRSTECPSSVILQTSSVRPRTNPHRPLTLSEANAPLTKIPQLRNNPMKQSWTDVFTKKITYDKTAFVVVFRIYTALSQFCLHYLLLTMELVLFLETTTFRR